MLTQNIHVSCEISRSIVRSLGTRGEICKQNGIFYLKICEDHIFREWVVFKTVYDPGTYFSNEFLKVIRTVCKKIKTYF